MEDNQEKLEASQEEIDTVAEHYGGAPRVKATHMVTALQDRASIVLHRVSKEAMYETIKALEDRFGDQHLAAAYFSQLKTRTQHVGESP
jgi:hypothetical protein